jgi:hypothetical protein
VSYQKARYAYSRFGATYIFAVAVHHAGLCFDELSSAASVALHQVCWLAGLDLLPRCFTRACGRWLDKAEF